MHHVVLLCGCFNAVNTDPGAFKANRWITGKQSDRPKWQHQLCRRPGLKGKEGEGWQWGRWGMRGEHLSAWWRHPAPAAGSLLLCVIHRPPARPHRPGGWIQTLWFHLTNPSPVLKPIKRHHFFYTESGKSGLRLIERDSDFASWNFLRFLFFNFFFCTEWNGVMEERGMWRLRDGSWRR